MNKILFLIIFSISFNLVYMAGNFFDFSYKNVATVGEATAFSTSTEQQIIKDEKIKIAFVGDIMIDRGVESKIKNHGSGDYNFIFENIKNDLLKYDFLVGNLEGPASDKGEDRRGLYSFRMNPEVINVLKNSNFLALSVANNHINNWGLEALKDTVLRLDEAGIKALGGGMSRTSAYGPRIIEIKGVKIGILAFSEFTDGPDEAGTSSPGIALISEESLRKSIEKARQESDIVVVSFHFGEEYELKQNSHQKKYAEMAINLGADLVVGHHPHVVQPLVQYKNSYIAYSLGNFIFDQPFSEETMKGGLLEVEIENKKIESVNLKNIKINTNFQPSLEK